MFFTHISQMMTEGAELTLVMRKTDNQMVVSLLPKVQTLKESTRNRFVPLVLNGTPAELDAGFFPAVAQPVQRAIGLMLNLAEFDKQAEKAAASNKTTKSAAKEKEPKEVREKREKYEKYIKRAEEQMTAKGFDDAIFSFQQARLHATEEQMRNIAARIAAARTQLNQGSLFGPPTSQPAPVAPTQSVQPAAQGQPMSVTTPPPQHAPEQPVSAYPQTAHKSSYQTGYPQQPLPPMPQYEHTYPGVDTSSVQAYDNPPTYRPEEYAGYVDFPQGMVAPHIQQPMAQ